jgi:hypothetical protein
MKVTCNLSTCSQRMSRALVIKILHATYLLFVFHVCVSLNVADILIVYIYFLDDLVAIVPLLVSIFLDH